MRRTTTPTPATLSSDSHLEPKNYHSQENRNEDYEHRPCESLQKTK